MRIISFYEYLISKKDEDSPVGDLARDVEVDPDCPRNSTALAFYLADKTAGQPSEAAYERVLIDWQMAHVG